jgi:hypothetical protein
MLFISISTFFNIFSSMVINESLIGFNMVFDIFLIDLRLNSEATNFKFLSFYVKACFKNRFSIDYFCVR